MTKGLLVWIFLLLCSQTGRSFCEESKADLVMTSSRHDVFDVPQQKGRQLFETLLSLATLLFLFEFFNVLLSFGAYAAFKLFQEPDLKDDKDDEYDDHMYQKMTEYMDTFRDTYDRISHEYGYMFNEDVNSSYDDNGNDVYYDIDRSDASPQVFALTTNDGPSI